MSHKYTPQDLRHYQRKAILHQLYYPESMLWLGMSLGKTVITLSSIEHRMRAGQVTKTLVFGPVRVIHAVWEREARKWSHAKHLRFSIVHGSEKTRLKRLFKDADIYLCNYENMAWLSNILDHYYTSHNKPLPFQMVVYDEISRVKNSLSQRVDGGRRQVKPERIEMLPTAQGFTRDQYLTAGWTLEQMVEHQVCRVDPAKHIQFVGWRKMIPHFAYRTGLTGTPASNGYQDLHGQYLAIDGGKRLGVYVTHFRDAYLQKDYMGWNYDVTDLGKRGIEHRIADITLEMKTEDYLELPETIINDIEIELPPKIREKYEEVERDMFTRLDNGTEIEVFSRASVSNKCLQFCSGTPYIEPENPEWFELHDEKYQALDSILEEAAGQPVAVSYQFRSDAERMMKRYKHLKPVNVSGMKPTQVPKLIKDWTAGNIRLLIGHAASAGHGLDGLQDAGDILVWFGLNWSLELNDQFNARFMRQGRTRPLTIHRLLCPDTVDMAVKLALDRKRTDEMGLKEAINLYRRMKYPDAA
jgi:SNF2 family DNA or RNA helicase